MQMFMQNMRVVAVETHDQKKNFNKNMKKEKYAQKRTR